MTKSDEEKAKEAADKAKEDAKEEAAAAKADEKSREQFLIDLQKSREPVEYSWRGEAHYRCPIAGCELDSQNRDIIVDHVAAVHQMPNGMSAYTFDPSII